MSGFDEQVVEDGVFEEVEPACVAMVPLAPAPPHWARRLLNPRPDPTFVAHLIATAEQLPQTRSLRRPRTRCPPITRGRAMRKVPACRPGKQSDRKGSASALRRLGRGLRIARGLHVG